MKSTQNHYDDPQFRADIYQLLAALYRAKPSSELLTYLADLHIEPNNSPFPRLLSTLQQLQQESMRLNEEDSEQIYFQLFVGVAEGEVSPFACSFIEGRLMANTLVQLRSELRGLGIKQNTSFSEPEDHISALFEIMSILISEGKLVQQYDFYQHYLAPWMTDFCHQLKNNKVSNFYQVIADFTHQFLALEQAILANYKLHAASK